MMPYRWPVRIVTVLSVWAAGQAASNGDALSTLQHNPFQRPEASPQSAPMQSPDQRENEETREVPPEFVLKATLVSDARPLVDVDGEIISVGDEYLGYRLVAVEEGKAVFAKGDRQYTLIVGAESKEQVDD